MSSKQDKEGLDSIVSDAKQYYDEGNYTKALDMCMKGINIAEKQPQLYHKELMDVYHFAGNIHAFFNDFELALEYYDKSYKESKILHRYDDQFDLLNNMLGINCIVKNVNEAERLNELAFRVPNLTKSNYEYSYSLNKGFIELARNNQSKARDYLFTAIKAAVKYKLPPDFECAPYSEIYASYEKDNQIDSALIYALMYSNLSMKYNLPTMIVDSNKGLMRLYTKLGQKDKALYYQEQYMSTSDSIFNLRNFYKIRNEQQMYVSSKNNEKIETLSSTVNVQKIFLIFSIGIIALIVIFLIILIRHQKRLRNAYKGLFDKNKELMVVEAKYKKALKELDDIDEHTHINLQNEDKIPQNKFNDAILLKKITKIMEETEEYCNSEFSLISLAKMVDSNTKYVSQIINDTYNKNFRTYINEYRIKLARKRLMDMEEYGNYTIQGIAESVGYKSSTNFIIAFKKVTGITPSLYQKMVKENSHNYEL